MDTAEILAALSQEAPVSPQPKVYPTGLYSLDLATGGVRSGRITDVYGEPDSGKTALALAAAAQASQDEMVCWVSAATLDKRRALAAGVNLDHLVVVPPMVSYDILDFLTRTVENDFLVVVDSTATIDDGSSHVLVAEAFGRFHRALRRSQSAALFIDPLSSFDNETAILAHTLSSVRVKLTRENKHFRGLVRGISHQPIRFTVDSDGVIDTTVELVRLGLDTGVLQWKGSWIFAREFNLGQGVYGAAETIRGTVYEGGIWEDIKASAGS